MHLELLNDGLIIYKPALGLPYPSWSAARAIICSNRRLRSSRSHPCPLCLRDILLVWVAQINVVLALYIVYLFIVLSPGGAS